MIISILIVINAIIGVTVITTIIIINATELWRGSSKLL